MDAEKPHNVDKAKTNFKNSIICMYVCVCTSAISYVDVRGQCVGDSSPSPCGSQLARFGGKCPYPLSHLVSLNNDFVIYGGKGTERLMRPFI